MCPAVFAQPNKSEETFGSPSPVGPPRPKLFDNLAAKILGKLTEDTLEVRDGDRSTNREVGR